MTCEVQNVVHVTSAGQIVILDATGFSFSHLASINLVILKKILFYIQEAAPVRLKTIHILNTMPVVDALVDLVKPFMKKELLNIVSVNDIIIHTHKNFSFFSEKKKYKNDT